MGEITATSTASVLVRSAKAILGTATATLAKSFRSPNSIVRGAFSARHVVNKHLLAISHYYLIGTCEHHRYHQ